MPIVDYNQHHFKLGRKALIFAIMTLVTVLCWVFFETYRSMTKDTIPKITKTQIAPLEPTLKKDLFAKLETRVYLSEQALNVAPPPAATESASETNEED